MPRGRPISRASGISSGCGSAWLARLSGGQKVASSNLAIPTIFLFSAIQSFMTGFFCVLILPKEPQAFTAQFSRNREQIENAKFSLNRCVLNKVPANSLFIKVGGRLCPFVLQVIREQGFTEAHAEITQESLFFAILYLPIKTTGD